MVLANGSTPAKPRTNTGLLRIGRSELRFPAERVWTLGPPGYSERLPGETDLRQLHGIVVVVALLAEDIVEQLAHRLRFHDASRLSNHIFRLFGHRPPFIRERLGFDWLLADWLDNRMPYSASSCISGHGAHSTWEA